MRKVKAYLIYTINTQMNLPSFNNSHSEYIVLINRFFCLFVLFFNRSPRREEYGGKEEFERRGRSQLKH